MRRAAATLTALLLSSGAGASIPEKESIGSYGKMSEALLEAEIRAALEAAPSRDVLDALAVQPETPGFAYVLNNVGYVLMNDRKYPNEYVLVQQKVRNRALDERETYTINMEMDELGALTPLGMRAERAAGTHDELPKSYRRGLDNRARNATFFFSLIVQAMYLQSQENHSTPRQRIIERAVLPVQEAIYNNLIAARVLSPDFKVEATQPQSK